MAKGKIDFTAADKNLYSGIIGGINTENTIGTENTESTETTENIENTTNTKRKYNRLDPRNEAPKEYRFTARMPGEYGRFLNELAYQRRSTITAELQRLVAEEMEKHPEILASLDELNL